MKYRVVRPGGQPHYYVQWSLCGVLRGYEKDYSARCLAPGCRPNLRFKTYKDAMEHIYTELAKRKDRGEKWPWWPTLYP